MYFKNLLKKEKKHLREMGITTLREMKKTAEAQAEMRKAFPENSEPCWDCRSIAKKLELPV